MFKFSFIFSNYIGVPRIMNSYELRLPMVQGQMSISKILGFFNRSRVMCIDSMVHDTRIRKLEAKKETQMEQ